MIHFKNRHLTVFQSALFKTTSVVAETKDLILVTDPNWLPQEVEEIRNYVEKIKGNRPIYLLFTHSDFDHILGYKAFPEAKVITGRALLENSDQEGILQQIHEFDDKYYLERDYKIIFPIADIIVEKDGQTLTVGETTLTFYTAPGHTPDGIFTILEPGGVWIAGDYLSDIEFPFIYDSSTAYEETLLKADTILSTHDVKLLVPGHGNVTESLEEIRTRQQDSLIYIRELRTAVINEDNKAVRRLFKDRPFRESMKAAHANNEKRIKGELLK